MRNLCLIPNAKVPVHSNRQLKDCPPGDVEWVLCGISKRNPEAIGWTGKCRTRREREREGREKKCDGCGGLCSSKQAGKAGPAKPNQAKAEVVYDVGCRC